MDKWEYHTIKFETKGFSGGILELQGFETQLNALGSQGWELISCFDTNQSYGATREVIAIFKRKI
ncbi:hypothetical protein OXPF_15000 [Oxobacter pfennigii]|uniref:DUF4177 domain-containing protein n=1 Tax=Oxobacter pfennigii TaxID=36849 RepID=A0A0P8WAP6_9CLOT|nr:DUF4177 domain-containing protein [Oxobacter pfennigii]KPU45022.1 hypothetical protein OXPF_15000 [Oxobacter pfennigii]